MFYGLFYRFLCLESCFFQKINTFGHHQTDSSPHWRMFTEIFQRKKKTVLIVLIVPFSKSMVTIWRLTGLYIGVIGVCQRPQMSLSKLCNEEVKDHK